MVAMHLAHAVGGDLMFGFLAAITFATILAVVSGLALAGASAIARDFYVHVICRGVADEARNWAHEVRDAGTGCRGHPAGHRLPESECRFHGGYRIRRGGFGQFSRPLPVDVLARPHNKGALAGGYTGLVSAVALVCASKSVWVNVLGYADALFPYEQPALFSMPLAFAVAIVVSLLDRSEAAASERAHDSSICMCAARPGWA